MTGVFAIRNYTAGCGNVAFTVSSNQPWVSVSPMSMGLLQSSQSLPMSLSVNSGLLPMAEGTYNAVVTVTSNTGDSYPISVVTTRASAPPAIVSSTGVCSARSGAGSVTIQTTGDVIGVAVTIDQRGGTSVPVTITGGPNTWTGMGTVFLNPAPTPVPPPPPTPTPAPMFPAHAIATGKTGAQVTRDFTVTCGP
jgi:hypothetical protein